MRPVLLKVGTVDFALPAGRRRIVTSLIVISLVAEAWNLRR
jgi:hypothetical protein